MMKANVSRLAYVGSKPGASRDSDSWYTPPEYLDAARLVMGGIGLDPFSSEVSNTQVRAETFLTADDDALTTSWVLPASNRSVWLNPPYSRGLCALAVNRFLSQYHAKAFDRAVVLVNNATETRWFQALLRDAYMVCLTDHRIAFVSPDGKSVSNNTRGQAFFYFESDTRKRKNARAFRSQFSRYGTVFLPMGAQTRISKPLNDEV